MTFRQLLLPPPLIAVAALLLTAVLATEPGRELPSESKRVVRQVSGWSLHIHPSLLANHPEETETAIKLLRKQLDEIASVLPPASVAELRKVSLWFSPVYPGTRYRAEYHPGAEWLKENARDPAMAKGVEFTNIPQFEAEMKRMPNFALHELAHAWHDRVIGNDEPRIIAAYEKAKKAGRYDVVERQLGDGTTRRERAYAMTNHKEYFAEATEAYYSRNDYVPYTREELKQHDRDIHDLLPSLWTPPEK